MKRLTLLSKLLIAASICIAGCEVSVSSKPVEEKQTFLSHPFRCETDDDAWLTRCENDEVICYYHSRLSGSAPSCIRKGGQ